MTSDKLGESMAEHMLSTLSAAEKSEFHRIVDKLVTELRSVARNQKKGAIE